MAASAASWVAVRVDRAAATAPKSTIRGRIRTKTTSMMPSSSPTRIRIARRLGPDGFVGAGGCPPSVVGGVTPSSDMRPH